MSKRRRRNRVVTKAAPRTVAPAATFTAGQVAALAQAMHTPASAAVTPLPRMEPMVAFGPGVPIQPGGIDPVNPQTGRPEPRITEYPVTINLPGMSDRLVPWKVLRDAAEIPVVRDCIRIRKNELTALEWDIVVSKRALQNHRKRDPGRSSVQIERDLRERLAPEVDRMMRFWAQPDWQQGETFVEWSTKLMEEHLVLDAVAIYPFQDRGKTRTGLRIVDGSTIKPLLDHLGGRPMPPNPAYQQLLWGFPRGEYIADVDDEGKIPGAFSTDRLIYKRKEVRAITPYGFSCVEQSLQDVDLYLRRMEWDKANYTDGVQPAGWILNEGHESWSPQQLAEYNRAFNDLYAGQTLARMRYHLLPPGMKPVESADIPEKYKPDYHLHLIKLVAMHFDVTMAELGFTETGGLGSSGYHEGQENVQERKATNPTLVWLQALLTDISRNHLGMPEELEFKFLGLDSEDQAAADEVLEKQLKSGRITWNEAREEMGRTPYDFDEAAMPVVQTTRGLIFVENASLLTEPGEEVVPVQAPPQKAPPEGGDANPYEQQDNPAPVVQQRRDEQNAKDQADEADDDAAPPPGKRAAKAAAATGIADRVYEQLADDYPRPALKWVHEVRWTGPTQVPLDKVDFTGVSSWRASREPGKVARFARAIGRGQLKPVVLVDCGRGTLRIVDGHHRSLAYRKLGHPVTAWVAHVDSPTGPWSEMHSSQFSGHDALEDDPDQTKELAAYRKWARNGHTAAKRGFQFASWSPGDLLNAEHITLDDITAGRVLFKAGGDADPKAAARPHRDHEQQAVRYWAKAFIEAMRGAPTRALAQKWLALRKTADRRADAEAWLVAAGFTLLPVIRRILAGLWADGYLIGDRKARHLLHGETPPWSGWTPGDTDTAVAILAAVGAAAGLADLRRDLDRTAAGINGTRLRILAAVLADAVEAGMSEDDLDQALADALADPDKADAVADTELSRAAAAAALWRYVNDPAVVGVTWVTGGDNVCPVCRRNAGLTRPPGAAFPSGHPQPPVHPHCHCDLIPQTRNETGLMSPWLSLAASTESLVPQ